MNERERLVSAADQLLAIDLLLGNSSLVPGRSAALPPAVSVSKSPLPQANMTNEEPRNSGAKPATLDEIAREVAGCTRCDLCKTRKNVVPGEGNPKADLVFVGEAPGADEDESGSPFVGRAGQLLTKMILAMGLSRQEVFICNMLKCRPPGNRHPAPDELDSCRSYLAGQLAAIQPKVIVTLGNPATQGLLETKTGITRLRGTWQSMPDTIAAVSGTAVMPTFHPSYVLRRYNADTRGKVWSDLQQVMDRIGLKIPETGQS